MHGSRLFWKLFLTCCLIVFLGTLALTWVQLRRLNWQRLASVEVLLASLGHVVGDNIAAEWDDRERLLENVTRTRQQLARDMPGLRLLVMDASGTPIDGGAADSAGATTGEPTWGDPTNAPDFRSVHEGHAPVLYERAGQLFLTRRIERDDTPLGYVRFRLPRAALDQSLGVKAPSVWPAFAITFLVAAAGLYWTARSIVGPIGELTIGARQLLRGEPLSPNSFSRDDELGTLAETLRNMDEQVRAREGQVRETAELLSTVLEGMTEGVLSVDNAGKILFANPAARSILGVPTERVAGKALADITRNPMVRLAVTNAMTSTGNDVAQRESETLEMVSEASPNEAYVLNAARLKGEPCPGVVVSFHDVSDMRRLEQMRQEFVSNVSHELKTPLSCIKAYAETLRAGAIDDADVNRQFLSRIEEQADRLNDLILDMIRLARIETGQQAFEITSVSVAEIVDVSFHRYQTAAEERNVSLHCDTELADLKVRADEEGLQQILDNLVDNAVKYSRNNGNVHVSWRLSGDDVVISVADDGLGIRPEDEKRVFERFYRVDKARSSELGSTGLGLSIVKHMARAFGGGVALESEYGRGSTFHVRLLKA